MNKAIRIFLTLGTIYLSLCLVLFPDEGISIARNSLFVCANSVIPALFPYLVASGYLSASGAASAFSRYLSPLMQPVFGVPGSGAIALVLGCLSGYPIGAVCASELYTSGECTKAEAEKLMAFCNNSGPLFIMSVVGCGFLNSPHIGVLLYISHIFSAILVGIILRSYGRRGKPFQKSLPKPLSLNTKNTFRILGGVMDNSVFTMLKICGFIIFFTVLSASLPRFGLSPFIHAFLEITGGIQEISVLETAFDTKLSIISFFMAFSGVSVLCQVGAVASKSGLSLRPYIFGKLLQGAFSAALTKMLISKLPETVDVFAGVNAPLLQGGLIPSMLMLFFALAVLGILLLVAWLSRRNSI